MMNLEIRVFGEMIEEAIERKDFLKAAELKDKISEYRKNIEAESTNHAQAEIVRVTKEDTETVCWCLELLTAVLTHGNISKMSPALIMCR